MELITQKELAKIVGVSAAYIAKLKKSGIFDNCFFGKKLIKKCAVAAITEIRKKESVAKESKVDTAKEKKERTDLKALKKELKNSIPKQLKEDGDIESKIDTLANLLLKVDNPAARVAITKEFWAGKINEIKYLQQKGELVERAKVESEFFEIGLLLREKFLALPNRLAGVVAVMDNKQEIANLVEKEIKEILESVALELEK